MLTFGEIMGKSLVSYYMLYFQATSFYGVFLLVPFYYIALVCNYCFLLWLIKHLSIYLVF